MFKWLSYFCVCFFLAVTDCSSASSQLVETPAASALASSAPGTGSESYWEKYSSSPTENKVFQQDGEVAPRSVDESDAGDRNIGDYAEDDIPELDSTAGEPTLNNWPTKTISQITVSPFLQTKVPEDQSIRLLRKYARDWNRMESIQKSFQWDAPCIRYKPLLFEDVALERYGQRVRGDFLQPAFSAIHFFSSAALLPLHARHDPVWSCDYPLGYCRPGNCTDRIYQRYFWNLGR